MIPLKAEISIKKKAWVSWVLVLANFWVFFKQLQLGTDISVFIEQYALIPSRLLQIENPKGWGYFYPFRTLMTSIFLHGGWLHLMGNMLTLWVFGPGVESRLGHLRFLFFYLICGLASGAVHVISIPHSVIPCLGASGAISGVLGAFLLLYPRAKVRIMLPLVVLIRIIHVPAFIFLMIWFLGQLLLAANPQEESHSIAVMAHIGGFLFGLISMSIFKKKRLKK